MREFKIIFHFFQTMFLAVGRGILYSTGTDLSLKSWQLGALTEMEKVEVRKIREAYENLLCIALVFSIRMLMKVL